MKYTLGILASVALAATSGAVTLSVGLDPGAANISGGTGRGLFDNAGNALLGTYVGYGTFSRPFDPATDDGAALAGIFDEFGSSGLVTGTDVGGGTIVSGTFFHPTSQAVPAGDPLENSNIWVVFGNADTLAGSTEALIIPTGVLFGNDDPTPGQVAIDLQTSSASPTFGSDSFQGTFVIPGFGEAPSAANSYQLAPLVPEPSSSLLFGFAGLALLIRRKR